MHILTLIENTTHSALLCEHGLSFYIETPNHRLLVDTGSSGRFLENARVLGVDISGVDTAILSHGHYDHCGGLHLSMPGRKEEAVGSTVYYTGHCTGMPALRLLQKLMPGRVGELYSGKEIRV